jgi:hypothetical protein
MPGFVEVAEGQTTHNLEIIFQRGIPDTSLRYWGAAIAGVGDVNGDGYDDVAVGAYKDLGSPNMDTAKVYIFYGSSSMDTIPDLLISDWSSGTGGLSICGGDVNGDGISDICITAAGRVYIHFGGSPPSINPDIRFGGRLYENYSVIAAGDINGDDTTDLIVGDYWNLSGNGHVNIYLGSAAFDTIPWLEIRGKDYEQMGSSLSAGADLNDDGINDLAVGAATYNADSRGRLYAIWGGASMDTMPDWWKDGEGPQQYWGEMGCHLCSINNDTDQYWAGSFYYPGGYWSTRNNGKAVLFNGGNPTDTFPDMEVIGIDTFTLLGTTFTTSLIDSNLRGDYICGSLEPAGTGMGRCWTSSSTQDSIMDGWLTGRWFNDRLGVNVANAGDVDNDGNEEVMLGSYADTNRLVVICKYTGPNGIEIINENNDRAGLEIIQTGPNPANGFAEIKYRLLSSCRVKASIYNINGQRIKNLIDGSQSAGSHSIIWRGKNHKNRPVASGLYFLRVQADEVKKTVKIIITR